MLIESDSEHGHLSPTLPAGLRSHTGAVVCCAAEEQQDMLRAVSSAPTIRSPTAKKFERELAKLRGSYTPS